MAPELAAIAVLLLVVAVTLIVVLTWRRVRLVRQGGIDVALRDTSEDETSRWHLGIGRYAGDELIWYRVTSLRAGPDSVLHRTTLEIVGRRDPAGFEAYAMPADATVVRCRGEAGDVELAMDADALTGFLSWLESAPPGRAVPWAS